MLADCAAALRANILANSRSTPEVEEEHPEAPDPVVVVVVEDAVHGIKVRT